MKRTTAGTILILILFLSSSHAQEPEKYVPRSKRKQEKLATAEPGTYLKPAALSILNRINRVMEDSARGPAPWMIDLVTPQQKEMIDTVLCYNELEVPVRIYYPTRKSLKGQQPVILFFHGGGFVYGSIEQYNMMAGKLAKVCDQIVVSVGYRLAPEHPFPAAINDCYAALLWLQQNGQGVGADTSRITVMGDSAGGNLATVVTLISRDRNTPQPCCQVLLYPAVTFVDRDYPSMTYFLKDSDRVYVLSESFLRRARTAYKGSEGQDQNPYISPLEARLSDDLAPALIIAAECDPLRDSQRAYAKKLEMAGTEVRYLEYSGMTHAFMSFYMFLGDARHAMKEIHEFQQGN